MIHLIIAIAFGSLFAILFKLFQRHGIDSLQAIGINYFIAWLLGFIEHAATEAPLVAFSAWIVPALFAGLFMMGGFVMMSKATRSHGVAIATISARISFIIPVLLAYLFLQGDTPRWSISALVILALLLIFFNRNDKNQLSSSQWIYPFVVFLFYGIANFLLKFCQQLVADAQGGDADLNMITSMAFLAAFAYTVIYYFFQSGHSHSPFTWKTLGAGITLGCVNIGCTYSILKSLMVMDSSLFYPVYNLAIVLIVTIVGQFYFKEQLSKIQYIGIAIALLSIALFFLT